MKVEIFTPVSYYGPVDKYVADATALLRPAQRPGVDGVRLRAMRGGHNAGFDSLNFAEHHYSINQLSPSPIFYAGLLGQRLPDAQIGVLGSDLPLHNPVQLAEEYSMLDNLLGGRLKIGLLRGTPNEYLTYGTNPWDSKESFNEGVRLFIRALTEPEPFGWEGRYHRYRNVSIWPQPLQRPHPRILLSGNSADSAAVRGRGGLRHRVQLPASRGGRREPRAVHGSGRDEAGWEPTADNILYRQFCFVEEDGDAAKAKSGPSADWPRRSARLDLMMTMGLIGAAMNGLPKGVPLDPTKGGPLRSTRWNGTPEHVLAQHP